ncbi:MAG: hypothetical protein IJ583_06510 [Firmicutes bacterium]|nr:hypothetical protein [Bacillota bacterium]
MANVSNFYAGTTNYAVRDTQAEALLVDNASKNLLPLTLENIKSLNTNGTWSDSVYAIDGVIFTINKNDVDYVTSIVVNGTAEKPIYFRLLAKMPITNGSYILNGCPDGGSEKGTYRLYCFNMEGSLEEPNHYDTGHGVAIQNFNNISVRIGVAQYYNANNITFYPMLRRAEITDDTFEAYYSSVKQLDKNLTIAIEDLQLLDTDLTALENKVSNISKDNADNLSVSNSLGNINILSINDGININARANVDISSDGSTGMTSKSGAINLTAINDNVNVEANNLYMTIDGESRMTLKSYIQRVVDGTIKKIICKLYP